MFTDRINEIPYTPRTQTGTGVLPPMLRAMGHVLYLAGRAAEENPTVTVEEAEQELTDAIGHWTAIDNTSLSTAANATLANLNAAIDDARTEFSGWEAAARITNLRNLANRICAVAATLDAELVGITGSDPGSTL